MVQPGRRFADEEREEIATEVADQVALTRVEWRRRDRVRATQWFVVWLITLVLSAWGAYRGAQAGDDAKRAANSAKAQAHQIQVERKRTVNDLCVDQNLRHRDTIAELDKLLAAVVKRDPSMARRMAESRKATVLLINALAPHQNCKQVVANAVGSGG